MSGDLEDLVRRTESAINSREVPRPSRTGAGKARLPRLSVALIIWLTVIILVSFQYSTIASLILSPAESEIEADLGEVIESSAHTLNSYLKETGSLPALLPNPSIRGLVDYDRQGDFAYTLRATIGDVTMVMDSRSAHASREYPAE